MQTSTHIWLSSDYNTFSQYCKQQTLAKPMITGHQQINMKTKWRPNSGAEQLAGPLVGGPGTQKNSARNSVLHNCRGVNCSLCEV